MNGDVWRLYDNQSLANRHTDDCRDDGDAAAFLHHKHLTKKPHRISDHLGGGIMRIASLGSTESVNDKVFIQDNQVSHFHVSKCKTS